MPIYVNSKGEDIDTSTLEDRHLERALAKAQREDNQPNITALEQELQLRTGETQLPEEEEQVEEEDYQ